MEIIYDIQNKFLWSATVGYMKKDNFFSCPSSNSFLCMSFTCSPHDQSFTQYTIQQKISSSINNDLFTKYVYCTCIFDEHEISQDKKWHNEWLLYHKNSLFSLSLAPEQPFVWLWVCWDYFQVANQPTRSEKRNVIHYLRFDFFFLILINDMISIWYLPILICE